MELLPWKPDLNKDSVIMLTAYRHYSYHKAYLGMAQMEMPCTGFNKCPICDLFEERNKQIEFLESKKGFWTDSFNQRRYQL